MHLPCISHYQKKIAFHSDLLKAGDRFRSVVLWKRKVEKKLKERKRITGKVGDTVHPHWAAAFALMSHPMLFSASAPASGCSYINESVDPQRKIKEEKGRDLLVFYAVQANSWREKGREERKNDPPPQTHTHTQKKTHARTNEIRKKK